MTPRLTPTEIESLELVICNSEHHKGAHEDAGALAREVLSRFTIAGAWRPWSDDARKHKRVIAIWLWTNDDGQECGQDTQEIIELDKHLDFWMNYNLHQIPALPSHYALLPAPPSSKETT